MKAITTFILIFLSQSFLFGQANPAPAADAKAGNTAVCTLIYSETGWLVEHKDTLRHKCSELVIKSIPPLTQASTPINIPPFYQAVPQPKIILMGSYVLKKDPSLVIPADYTVVIEDVLTGQYYNISSATPYTFSMNRASGDARFILEISKTKSGSPTAAR